MVPGIFLCCMAKTYRELVFVLLTFIVTSNILCSGMVIAYGGS